MSPKINLNPIQKYFSSKLESFGATPQGVDWNSEASQDLRFAQLTRILPEDQPYSLIDYGSGFGSLYDLLKKQGHTLDYYGFDIVDGMVSEGQRLHANDPHCTFTTSENSLPIADYAIASGIFNIKLDTGFEDWTQYVLSILQRMHALTRKGFSFNLLTRYSDVEHMRVDLYYADPAFYFTHCKIHFARNVALLHDYGLYDFTILVRKEL